MKKLIIILVVFVVIITVVTTVVLAGKRKIKQTAQTSDTHTTQTEFVQQEIATTSKDSPPLKLKHLSVNFGPYDAASNKAGDFLFTKSKLGEFDMPLFDFGYAMPANSAGPTKKNPQPTFIVPLGTKVRAIVDGVVVDIPKLYSNDYSVMIAKDKNSPYIYEMEHVMNVTVNVGDTVKAGDVVAEVSDYDTRNMPGYGLVEIGILKGGNPPTHICPYLYLDNSIKDKVLNDLKTFYADWNAYRGKTVYDVTTYAQPGCVSTDEIEG